MVRDDTVKDKTLRMRLIKESMESKYEEKWVKSIDAYNVLCPDDPMGLQHRQTHRAIDDAVMEAHILDRMVNWDFVLNMLHYYHNSGERKLCLPIRSPSIRI